MHSLNEEVSKLSRVVKDAQETQQQTQEQLHIEEEKLSNMSKANLKLTQQVDEVSRSGQSVCLPVCLSPCFCAVSSSGLDISLSSSVHNS